MRQLEDTAAHAIVSGKVKCGTQRPCRFCDLKGRERAPPFYSPNSAQFTNVNYAVVIGNYYAKQAVIKIRVTEAELAQLNANKGRAELARYCVELGLAATVAVKTLLSTSYPRSCDIGRNWCEFESNCTAYQYGR